MTTLFIYHGGCFDGHTAAWIYSRFVDRGAEFLPVKYGDAPPDVRGRDVIIADFSFPREAMFKIACDATTLVVLDHHKTAEEALDGLEAQVLNETGKTCRIVFDMERSGAGLTWDAFLSQGDPYFIVRPPLVNYVEDRDLWRMSLPHAHEYMANVYAAPMTFESWDELHARPLETMLARGEGILAYMAQYGEKALAEMRYLEFKTGPERGSYPVPCVNLPYMNCSDYLTKLLAQTGAAFVAGYFRRADGRWQFSLRSVPDYDVSEVAKRFGGGGHKQAAGFDVADLAEVFGKGTENA